MDLAQMKAAVTMEGLLSGAAALELIAEVERLRDQIEHPAAVVLELRGEISRLTALCDGYRGEVASLKEALDRIAHPVWWMQEDQLRATGSINGLDGEKTVALGRDHHFLKSIAERALAGAPIGVSAESALTRARADGMEESAKIAEDYLLRMGHTVMAGYTAAVIRACATEGSTEACRLAEQAEKGEKE